ncbi:P-loop containing nucleoside triphosphate hydrolase protein [Coprinopsis marcescibilis]|uniref:ATP-dependent DNA helicase n=1 Tax=Coprinopsis marcescibilis TaxID=230819 RepID=A0A5C3KRQ8_COPMA|nr:P-loop containing nucleoside triphosphate hydrolase protein [Coprinopsis marcescibilis]
MSSDGFFEDIDFDDAALLEIDALEAAALGSTQSNPPQPKPLEADSSFNDLSFDIDEGELEKLDDFVEKVYSGERPPVAGPSTYTGRQITRTNSNNLVQTTLFGGTIPSQPSSSKPRSTQLQRTKSATRNLFGKQAAKTKEWDHTAFSATGNQRKKPTKGKGKANASSDDEHDDGEDAIELPAPFIPSTPWPPKMHLKPDLLEAKHWIFPTNRSKRAYQYNIVKNALLENTLVALPTGMGKTFIAGVVMLNYYRWFPEGKIIFLAVTKPLVAQQAIACHETCGIPGPDGIEMTGNVRTALRARYWEEKRVFYMTPQTLQTDLTSGRCNPEEVILLVIDEAHHATGNHSYNQVIRYLMSKNPHFRVLALTATPGNAVEKVQDIIDGLHISHIEIRNEESIDLKPYIFEKAVKTHVLQATGDVGIVRDMLVKYIDKIAGPLRNQGLFISQAIKLHPYYPLRLLSESKNKRFYQPLHQLSQLARAMLYVLTGSIPSCHEYLLEIKEKEENDLKTNEKAKKVWTDNPIFKELMQKLDDLKINGSTPHPKMEKLINILVNFFGTRMPDAESGQDGQTPEESTSRVMVFSSYRAVVEEIVSQLESHKPLIRAAAFTGQATDKKGRKGLKQKEQTELIQRFQRGEFNVLVATCIGEEGLDIGEVDCTVCYDTDKAPIRMVQRFGRTGRKRAGEVHALLAETREEFNLDKAKEHYSEIQKVICRGEVFKLYADVPRLLPDTIKPECVEKVMEMVSYVPETTIKRAPSGQGGKAAPKRKRNEDPGRNIPAGMAAGFTPASDIFEAFKKKKRKVIEETIIEETRDFEELGTDDDDDKVIDDSSLAPARRTQSEKAAKKKKASTGIRRSKTEGGTKKRKGKGKGKGKENEPNLLLSMSPTELAKQGESDDDDRAIERGIFFGSPRRSSSSHFVATLSPARSATPAKKNQRPKPRSKSTIQSTLKQQPDSDSGDDGFAEMRGWSEQIVLRASSSSPGRQLDVIDVIDTEDEDSIGSPEDKETSGEGVSTSSKTTPSPIRDEGLAHNNDISWLVDDDDDDMFHTIEIKSSPPVPSRALSIKSSPPLPSPVFAPKFQRIEVGNESIEISEPFFTQKLKPRRVGFQSPDPQPVASGSRSKPTRPGRSGGMLPPPLPVRFNKEQTSPAAPEPTFPVQRLPPKRRRATVVHSDPSSSEESEQPPLSQRRLNPREESTPERPPKKKPKRAKPSLLSKNRNLVFDAEAAHSGDEVSEGYSDDEEEDEEDRAFIKNSPLTQAPAGYEQTQAYRRSLMTQVPFGDGPVFATRPIRGRPFGRMSPTRRFTLPSSSPGPDGEDSEPNEYEVGSFIVPDEADISLELNSDDVFLET